MSDFMIEKMEIKMGIFEDWRRESNVENMKPTLDREERVRRLAEYKLEFDETGGYECMTSAYTIKQGDKIICTIDLKEYGQKRCDFPYFSDEASEHAEFIFKALQERGYEKKNDNIDSGQKAELVRIAESLASSMQDAAGALSEFLAMPCESLRVKLFSTETRLRHRATQGLAMVKKIEATPTIDSRNERFRKLIKIGMPIHTLIGAARSASVLQSVSGVRQEWIDSLLKRAEEAREAWEGIVKLIGEDGLQ